MTHADFFKREIQGCHSLFSKRDEFIATTNYTIPNPTLQKVDMEFGNMQIKMTGLINVLLLIDQFYVMQKYC